MNKNLLGISGKMGSGKDTFFELLQKKTQYSYENKKFAEKVKIIASILTGFDVQNFENQDFKKTNLPDEWSDYLGNKMSVRQFMQKLGTDAMRKNLHENIWINALFSQYKIKDVAYPNWCITDVRFQNEYDMIKKMGGIMIRIERPNSNTDEHPSETSLDNHEFDYIIDNNGSLEEFKLQIEKCLNYFNI